MLADEKKPVEKQEEDVKNEVVVDGDIDLSVLRKKRFRIDGDNNRFVELNVSDMGIVSRLTEAYPKLEKLREKAIKMSANASDEDFDEVQLGKDIKALDKEMRDIIDSIFNSNISEVCVPDGTMFDPIFGKCAYEHVIGVLVDLYDKNISEEAKKIGKPTVSKRTKTYTKRK